MSKTILIEDAKLVLEAWDDYDGGTLDHPLSSAMENLRTAIEEAEKQKPVIDHSCKDTYELIMKWADIYAAQTGVLYSQAAQDPSKTARMADERTMLACVVAQAFSPPAQPTPTQEHQINQLEKFKNHVLANADALGVVLDAPAAQRQWVGLTEDELGELMKDSCGYPMCPNGDDLAFALAIEAKLKEKNA